MVELMSIILLFFFQNHLSPLFLLLISSFFILFYFIFGLLLVDGMLWSTLAESRTHRSQLGKKLWQGGGLPVLPSFPGLYVIQELELLSREGRLKVEVPSLSEGALRNRDLWSCSLLLPPSVHPHSSQEKSQEDCGPRGPRVQGKSKRPTSECGCTVSVYLGKWDFVRGGAV